MAFGLDLRAAPREGPQAFWCELALLSGCVVKLSPKFIHILQLLYAFLGETPYGSGQRLMLRLNDNELLGRK